MEGFGPVLDGKRVGSRGPSCRVFRRGRPVSKHCEAGKEKKPPAIEVARFGHHPLRRICKRLRIGLECHTEAAIRRCASAKSGAEGGGSERCLHLSGPKEIHADFSGSRCLGL